MRRFRNVVRVGVAVALVVAMGVVVGACGSSSDSAADTVTPGEDIQPGVDEQQPGEDVPAPADTYVVPPDGVLVFVDEKGDDEVSCVDYNRCFKQATYGQGITLPVRYLVDGQPYERARLRFTIAEDPDSLIMIEPGNGIALTNAQGQAYVGLQARTEGASGNAVVRVEVDGKANVNPLFFDIFVSKDRWWVTIQPEYEGRRTVESVVVRLFRHPPLAAGGFDPAGRSCEEIVTLVRQRATLPPADIAMPEVAFGASVPIIPDYFDGIDLDGQQMYTVLATGLTGGRETVVGCNDVDGFIVFEEKKTIAVGMHDMPPQLKGTFDVVSEFDLVTALPENVGTVVNFIIGFFQSPTTTLLQLLCLIDNPSLQDLCGYVFNTDGTATVVGNVIVTIVDALVRSLGEGSVWGTVLDTGGDVGMILKRLTFLSTIEFKAEPDIYGTLDQSQVVEDWNAIKYRWTLGIPGCAANPDCGYNQFSFTALGGGVVRGAFTAEVNTQAVGTSAPFSLLTIPAHAINVKYGKLLDYIIREIVIPALAGDGSDGLPRIDTYDKLLKSLLAGRTCLQEEVSPTPKTCCRTFAENLVNDPDGASVGITLAETACNALITEGANYVQGLLLGLDFETGDPQAANAFVIGTPDGRPCALIDSNGDNVIDALGSAAAKCAWKATIRLDINGGTEVTIDAAFTGTKR